MSAPRPSALASGLALGAALWLATPVHAQAQDSRLDAHLEPQTATAVREIVDAARLAGLPTEPLIAKALEGASKGADPMRIVGAVRAYADALREARDALGEAAQEAEIVAGAGAALVGVTPETLESLRAARVDGELTIPLVVLADLVTRGVPVSAAGEVVLTGLRAGARDADLMWLRERIERDIRAGAAPAAAAEVRSRALWSPLPDRSVRPEGPR